MADPVGRQENEVDLDGDGTADQLEIVVEVELFPLHVSLHIDSFVVASAAIIFCCCCAAALLLA